MTVDESLIFLKVTIELQDYCRFLRMLDWDILNWANLQILYPAEKHSELSLRPILLLREIDDTFFYFDEPTTGLHFHDISKLLKCFQLLLERNNSVVIIEHNLDVIKCADYIIDLGPEAGDKGGEIVATGTPEEIAENENSWTGKYLKSYLK